MLFAIANSQKGMDDFRHFFQQIASSHAYNPMGLKLAANCTVLCK
jgi:hypothetical protein